MNRVISLKESAVSKLEAKLQEYTDVYALVEINI